ncbi:Isochorismatase hydrolase [Cenococcum geophilum]
MPPMQVPRLPQLHLSTKNQASCWVKSPDRTFDFIWSSRQTITTPKAIPMTGSRKAATIEPSRSALWGLDNYDLLTMLPTLISSFSTNGMDSPLSMFRQRRGVVDGIESGPKPMRGSWNVRPRGTLYEKQVNGAANGTDIHPNKSDGLWQTPPGLWLQENEITTPFFGGANADQWGTFLDAYYKGFNVVYAEDTAATASPHYATETVK